jgi:hypothetical protein
VRARCAKRAKRERTGWVGDQPLFMEGGEVAEKKEEEKEDE